MARIIDDLKNQKANMMKDIKALMTGEALEGEQLEKFNNLEEGIKNIAKQIKVLEMEEADEKAEKLVEVDNSEDKSFENYMRFGKIENIATTTTGGYLVPVKLTGKIEQKVHDDSIIMQIADVMNVSGPLDIPVEADGVVAYWTAEGGETTVSDSTFGKVELRPHKLTALVKVTEEILADSAFDLESYISENAGYAFADEIDKQGFTGTQSTDGMLGLITTASVGHTASATNSITYEDIVKLYNSVDEKYAKRGVWVMSSAAKTAVMLMQDTAGHYIYTSPREGVPGKIFDRPVYVSADMDGVAAGKFPIGFGYAKAYKVARRQGLSVQRLDERYAESGRVGFRFVMRIDGKLTFSDAFKKLEMASGSVIPG